MFSPSQVRTLVVAGFAQVVLTSALPTVGVPSLSRSLHRRKEQNLEKGESDRKTWIMAGGLMVGIAILCTLIWIFWRWNIVLNFFPRKQKVHDISGPMMDGEYNNTKATKGHGTKSMRTKRSSMSESRSSLVYDDGESSDPSYNYRTYNNVSAPSPALAKSNLDLERMPSRRHLIREDLLTLKSQQNSHTLFQDEQYSIQNRHSQASSEHRSNVGIKAPKPAKTANSAYPQYVPPPIPDSPSRRYSWMSGKSGKTNRTSMESEPPKFRGVNSWVGDQTVRIEEKELKGAKKERRAEVELDQMTLVSGKSVKSVPPTPAEFKQHPGQVVEFLAGNEDRRK